MPNPQRMPDLARSTHAYHHTLDSALETLYQLNISPFRITIRMTASGLPEGWVVRQSPAPGAPLTDGDLVTLWISGAGIFRALPAPMWDKGNESEPGTEELIELYDDPLEKARHWLREGAKLFDISPDNLAACARWIALFGWTKDEWPVESWYPLALLLPHLQELAGKERGFRTALELLAGLPVEQIKRAPAYSLLAREAASLVAERSSRLGIDLIVGDRKEDLAEITIVVGPVPLDRYYEFQRPDRRAYLEAVLRLVKPMDQSYKIAWSVLDRKRAPRLGSAHENACLGINSHLGGRQSAPRRELAEAGAH
jgi:hypothetical protein